MRGSAKTSLKKPGNTETIAPLVQTMSSILFILVLILSMPGQRAGQKGQASPPPKQAPPTSPGRPQAPLSSLIDAAIASKQGLVMMPPSGGFSADWFARRYAVAVPALESARLANPAGSADIYALKPSPQDAARLWSGLEADLAPNEVLVEKRGVIGLVISPDNGLRQRIIGLIKPTRQAPARSDLDWLTAEMPRDIPGLVNVYARFLTQLPVLEARVDGVGLRAVYQASYTLPRSFGPSGLAQADFWVPRDPAQVGGLVRALDGHKTGEQTIMSGKGVAVLVSTRTNQATKILVDFLTQKRYKLESRVATFK